MRYALSLLLLLVGGCGAKTLGPEDFLYAYRCGAMPGEMASNSSARYLGREGTCQCIEIRSGRPGDTFVYDLTGIQKLRCRANLLPFDFPAGFESLKAGEGFENAEDTRQYVREYLGKHHRDTPERPGSPSAPDAGGTQNDPRSN